LSGPLSDTTTTLLCRVVITLLITSSAEGNHVERKLSNAVKSSSSHFDNRRQNTSANQDVAMQNARRLGPNCGGWAFLTLIESTYRPGADDDSSRLEYLEARTSGSLY